MRSISSFAFFSESLNESAWILLCGLCSDRKYAVVASLRTERTADDLGTGEIRSSSIVVGCRREDKPDRD